MKVINVHTRIIAQPKAEIVKLFKTLASENDQMLATDKWPRMKLDRGLRVGSKGGHAMITYFVEAYDPEYFIKFRFTVDGFNGYHQFKLQELEPHKTALTHTIDMHTQNSATIKWLLAIRWLHDAYIEDAFDKVENQFASVQKTSKWSLWVRFLRGTLSTKRS
jgi:hypothetical protein